MMQLSVDLKKAHVFIFQFRITLKAFFFPSMNVDVIQVPELKKKNKTKNPQDLRNRQS